MNAGFFDMFLNAGNHTRRIVRESVDELFEVEQAPLKAAGSTFPARAIDAVNMGLAETRRVMVTTYLTFARLFQGTVKIEHLKGPVGIAHLGGGAAHSAGPSFLISNHLVDSASDMAAYNKRVAALGPLMDRVRTRVAASVSRDRP